MSQPNLSPITVSGRFDKMGESLKALRDYAVQAAEIAGLSRNRIEGLRMAVDEYATNIITYGYRDSGRTGDIDAAATIDDEQLVIALVDSAAPYDPTQKADPTNLEDPLDEREIGGLGIMLTRQSLDEWIYEYVDGRNCNYFVLKRG